MLYRKISLNGRLASVYSALEHLVRVSFTFPSWLCAVVGLTIYRIEHPAAAFGARGTPHIMKLHEIMGIETNWRWGVCSLNEFRKVFDSVSSPEYSQTSTLALVPLLET
jgi:hypothetical protein